MVFESFLRTLFSHGLHCQMDNTANRVSLLPTRILARQYPQINPRQHQRRFNVVTWVNSLYEFTTRWLYSIIFNLALVVNIIILWKQKFWCDLVIIERYTCDKSHIMMIHTKNLSTTRWEKSNGPFTLPRGPIHHYRRDHGIGDQTWEYLALLVPTQ